MPRTIARQNTNIQWRNNPALQCHHPFANGRHRVAPETRARSMSVQQQREIAALIQALAQCSGWLAQEQLSHGRVWKLFCPTQAGAKVQRDVCAQLVALLQREGIITPREDDPLRWQLSPKGLRLLRLGVPVLRNAGRGCADNTTEEPASADACGDHAASRQPASGKEKKRSRSRQTRPACRESTTTGTADKRETTRVLVRDAESGRLRELEVNLRENPLMWLARRKDANGRPYLEPHHVAAGERLRQQYEIACRQPGITANWDAALSASDRGRLRGAPRDPFPFTERVMLAREQVQQALEAIGADLADVVLAVCCLEQGIEAAERTLNWPRRSARLVLRIALERLAAHYGLQPARPAAQQEGNHRWRKVLHWHAPDGKPQELLPPREQAQEQGQQEQQK